MTCARCGEAAPTDDHFCETCGLRLVPRVAQIQGPAVLGPDLAIVTDIGKRHARNEDAGAIVREIVDGQPAYALVVCDGVSSASSSDQLAAGAARGARTALADLLKAGAHHDAATGIADVIRVTHQAACALDLKPEQGKDPPGATIVAAVAWPGHVSVGWLGDSRAYWVTRDGAVALTQDDSVSPTSHAITHCIGPLEDIDGPLEPHSATLDRSGAGLLVLCSDGFWNYAADEYKVAELVRSTPAGADAETVARTLVTFALDAGGMDNVTVAIARLASHSNGVE
jgi:PPM family protein phosphatase